MVSKEIIRLRLVIIVSYVLMGKPNKVRKRKDGSIVHFSKKLERALKNRKVMDIT